MNSIAQFENSASRSRSTHEGESSLALCDRPSLTRAISQRQLPTDQDYAVSTREYQTDQSSLKPAPAAAGPVLDRRQKQRQQQKLPHRCAEVDRVTPYRTSRIAAQIRSTGVDPVQASRIAEEALKQALSAANDTLGAWILSPKKNGGSEVHWTGMFAGGLRSVRIDRLFKAGATPEAEGESFWWIIDYKTAHAPTEDHAATLAELRPLFAPQLAAYATVLRGMHGADAQIRAGLYYPRMEEFDWWEL